MNQDWQTLIGNSNSEKGFTVLYRGKMTVARMDHILECIVLIRNFWAEDEANARVLDICKARGEQEAAKSE